MVRGKDHDRVVQQLPLLKAISKRGGSIAMKGELPEVAAELADAFGLTPEQRKLARKGGENAWINHLQWVRNDLAGRGEIARGEYGGWPLTEKGRRRATGGDG